MNKTKKMTVQEIENFLNLCEVNVDFQALSGAQQHIVEKFSSYCKPRGITIKEIPSPHTVSIFASNKGKTSHIACAAIYNGVSGWVVNLDSDKESKAHKRLRFFPETEASCAPDTGKYCASNVKKIKERSTCIVAPVEKDIEKEAVPKDELLLTEYPLREVAGIVGFVN